MMTKDKKLVYCVGVNDLLQTRGKNYYYIWKSMLGRCYSETKKRVVKEQAQRAFLDNAIKTDVYLALVRREF